MSLEDPPHPDVSTASPPKDMLIARVASPAQVAAVCKWHNDCWRGTLSQAESEQRWHRFHASLFARGSRIVVLVPRAADETAMPLAAIELFSLRALWADAGSDAVVEVDALVATGAVVPEPHRGRGYMVALCQRYLSHLADGSALAAPRAMIGFSEAGAHIWEKGSGRAHPGLTYTWAQADLAHLELPDSAQYLRVSELEAIAELDRARLDERLRRRPRDRPRFSIVPSAAQYAAMLQRNFDTIGYARGRDRVPCWVGVLLDDHNYALWMHSYAAGAVFIIRLEVTTPANLASLLAMAGQEAAWYGLRSVMAWDAPADLVPSVDSTLRWAHAEPFARTNWHPMIRVSGHDDVDVDWVAIEASNKLFVT